MFSGIIADIGSIHAATEREGGLRLSVSTQHLDLSDVRIGDSIAVNGVCLTVTEISAHQFTVDVSRETLSCTVGLGTPSAHEGAHVNLEKALRLSDRLGGHLVSGHVDDIGEVVEFKDMNESWKLTVRAPDSLAKYLASKGCITINGVSLTINQVSGSDFSVNLIPHTLKTTNLKNLRAGSRINLEVDLIARYIERMMQASL